MIRRFVGIPRRFGGSARLLRRATATRDSSSYLHVPSASIATTTLAASAVGALALYRVARLFRGRRERIQEVHFVPETGEQSDGIMCLSNGDEVNNWTVIREHGVLVASSSYASNIFDDIATKLKALRGGDLPAYAEAQAICSKIAVEDLKAQASKLGANALIHIRLECKSSVDPLVWSSTYSYCLAYGTAVRVVPNATAQ